MLPEGAHNPVPNVSTSTPPAPRARSIDAQRTHAFVDLHPHEARSASAVSAGGHTHAPSSHAVSPPAALSPPPRRSHTGGSRHASPESPTRHSPTAAARHGSGMHSTQNSHSMSNAAHVAHASAAPAADAAADVGRARVRNVLAPPGTVIGDFDWVLHQPRSFQCVAESAARVLALTRKAHARLAVEKPKADGALLRILLRLSQVSTAHALLALDHVK